MNEKTKNKLSVAELNGVKILTTYAGIKKTLNNQDDLLLIEFENEAAIAGVFTNSLTSSAPVNYCKKNLNIKKEPSIRALVVNSGNANAFTGKIGDQTVLDISKNLSENIKCNMNQIYMASTGVIGEQLQSKLVIDNINRMRSEKKISDWSNAANAIRTTDTFEKIVSKSCTIDNVKIKIIGIAKGSGMIAPDMGTMLSFIFTNAHLSSSILQKILKPINEKSFNSITVDSDTSTSDTVLLVATKKAKHRKITFHNDPCLSNFKKTLQDLMLELAKLIVYDGEGASKFITINVIKGVSKKSAKKIALSIANSPLVKTAIAGEDANWGRIIMAIGKSGEKADRDKIKIFIGKEQVTDNGMICKNYSEARASKHLKQKEIQLTIDLGVGKSSSTIYTCDLTHKYIEINADYRS